jgi:hypothetical protein
MARDERYEDPYYDPNEPPSDQNIPDEPGPRPGDPTGEGTVIKQLNPRWNGGSPPARPLPVGPDNKTTHGWTWSGSDEYDPNGDWEQTPGRGMGFGQYNVGYTPPPPPSTSTTTTSTTTTPTPTSRPSGVPQTYATYSAAPRAAGATAAAVAPPTTSPIAGSIPTLAEAAAQAKQLFGSAPEIRQPGTFTPPTPVGMEDRNRIVQAILAQPDVMGQTFQDQLFEQQKEQQAQLAAQARARLSQATAARGLSAAGGQELLGQAGVEEGFINSLLSARRDVSMKAAEANRASRTAAVEMADAVTQGDFARAQAAYQTQLQANQIYNQLQMQAAELERGNVALVAQNLLAQREMALGEQGQSFDQYLRQLDLNERIRQFNESLAFDYGKFGWTQQINLAGLFPQY